jgi:hypothetical protein
MDEPRYYYLLRRIRDEVTLTLMFQIMTLAFVLRLWWRLG